jgi:hypothetical protein
VHARTLFEVESVRNLRMDKAFKLDEEKHRESMSLSV